MSDAGCTGSRALDMADRVVGRWSLVVLSSQRQRQMSRDRRYKRARGERQHAHSIVQQQLGWDEMDDEMDVVADHRNINQYRPLDCVHLVVFSVEDRVSGRLSALVTPAASQPASQPTTLGGSALSLPAPTPTGSRAGCILAQGGLRRALQDSERHGLLVAGRRDSRQRRAKRERNRGKCRNVLRVCV